MAFSRRTVASVGAMALAGVTACSLVLGLRDGQVGDTGTDGGGTDSGDAGADVDPNPLKDVVTVDVDNATCGDAARNYDPTAIHVNPKTGNDTSNCGAANDPCATLGKALSRAGNTIKRIYLAPGDYKEQVTLTPGYNGLTIEGGWDADWTSDCKSSLANLVDNRANTPGQTPTLQINNANDITLRLFTITSRNQGGVGESVSAMWVTGSTTNNITVDNMTLVSRLGGDGNIGATGNPSFGTNCFDGGSGAAGGQGTAGGDGTWGPTGFTPAGAGVGNPGSTGTAGAPGSPGASGTCISCGPYPQCLPSGTATDGNAGQNGCAGNGGFGGGGGSGGGPTAALFVWGPTVNVTGGTTFVTVQGGNGGAGGAGSGGTAGSAGADGPAVICTQSCTAVAFDGGGFDGGSGGFCSTTSGTIDGGKGGAPGGQGGTGGQGGGGKGGAAYLIVYGNGANVNVPSTILNQSSNGAPGNGGASNGVLGDKANVKTIP